MPRATLRGSGWLALSTLQEALRSRLWASGVLFAVGLVSVAALSEALGSEARARLIVDLGLAGMAGLGSALAIAAAVSALCMPLSSQQAMVYLVRPISPTAFVVGRYLGLSCALGLVLALAAACTYATLLLCAGAPPPPPALPAAMLAAVLEVNMILALSCLFSVLSTPVGAALYASGAWVTGSLGDELRALIDGSLKDTSLASALRLATLVLPDLSAVSLRSEAANGLSLPPQWATQAPVYAACYIVGALSLASIVLSRRPQL